jgi:hypothetical protein
MEEFIYGWVSHTAVNFEDHLEVDNEKGTPAIKVTGPGGLKPPQAKNVWASMMIPEGEEQASKGGIWMSMI